jgi:hypothetical protein
MLAKTLMLTEKNMSSGNTSSQRVAKALELNAKEDKQPEPLLIFIVVCLF